MIIAILLDGRETNIYHSGQIVSGNVTVETNEEIKMRGIRLEVIGDALVQWTEERGNRKITYKCKEVFIDVKTYLTGSAKGSEMILQPGAHTFPLSFHLPEAAPSTYDGAHGSVKYRLKAVIDRILNLDNSAEIEIAVVRFLDLNHEPPHLKVPMVVQEEKPITECCYFICCIKGYPEIEVRLNRGCFVPGETIVLNGKVFNNSSAKIRKTEISFIQEVQFCFIPKGQICAVRPVYKTLGSVERPQIESGDTDIWSDVTFTVPPVVASRLDGCSIINITYFILVKADFYRGCAESGIKQDIIIGHVPLQGDSHLGGPITAQPPMYTSPFPPVDSLPPAYTFPPVDLFPEKSDHSGVHGAEWNPAFEPESEDIK